MEPPYRQLPLVVPPIREETSERLPSELVARHRVHLGQFPRLAPLLPRREVL